MWPQALVILASSHFPLARSIGLWLAFAFPIGALINASPSSVILNHSLSTCHCKVSLHLLKPYTPRPGYTSVLIIQLCLLSTSHSFQHVPTSTLSIDSEQEHPPTSNRLACPWCHTPRREAQISLGQACTLSQFVRCALRSVLHHGSHRPSVWHIL